MGARLWMLAQPIVAVLALAGFAAALVFQAAGRTDLIPSVQALITAMFVYPGLAVSMIVNQAIVMARRPRELTTVEKLLVVAQFATAGLLALTSLDSGALLLGFLLWPLLIIAAVTACATMTSTTLRARRADRQTGSPSSHSPSERDEHREPVSRVP